MRIQSDLRKQKKILPFDKNCHVPLNSYQKGAFYQKLTILHCYIVTRFKDIYCFCIFQTLSSFHLPSPMQLLYYVCPALLHDV